MTIRQANELSSYIRTETLKSLSDPLAKPQKFIETDFFAKQLQNAVGRTRKGRELLAQPARDQFPERAISQVAKRLKKETGDVTIGDMLILRGSELAEAGKLDPTEVQGLKLRALGVSFNKEGNKPDEGKKPDDDKPTTNSR